jgi:hypothetical protein
VATRGGAGPTGGGRTSVVEDFQETHNMSISSRVQPTGTAGVFKSLETLLGVHVITDA